MKIIFVLLAISAVITVCRSADFPFPFPQRGAPRLLNQKDYPIEKWRERSQKTFPWFVEKPEGWYINWDAEAKELKYLVVHHSATSTNTTPEELSFIDLKRLYDCPAVYGNTKTDTPYVFGLPPHSAHVIDGKETFIPYHHLIYSDGTVKTTLIPFKKVGEKYFVDMIGWGAGKWAINCQAVQICLVGTFGKKNPPTGEALMSLRSLISAYKALSADITVTSHKEVRPLPTSCPGDWWDDWSKTLADK